MNSKNTCIQLLILLIINSHCFAGEYAESIKLFASGKCYVIENESHTIDSQKRLKSPSTYSPSMNKKYAEFNKSQLKKGIYNEIRTIWTISGRQLYSNGTRGESQRCVIASLPERLLHGPNPPNVSIMRMPDGYAFCAPRGEYDWILSGTEKYAVTYKELWFSDVKIDVDEYMHRVQIYENSLPEDKPKLMLQDIKRWSDLRGLASLELYLEGNVIDISTLTSIMREKSKKFQVEAAKQILTSKIDDKTKLAIFDPLLEGGWNQSLDVLEELLLLPFYKDEVFMTHIIKIKNYYAKP
jgi:hypothetical protein